MSSLFHMYWRRGDWRVNDMTRIKISLLPAELKRQSSMMRMWTIIALVLAILAMIMLAGNILFSFWLKTPVAELESLKTENKSMTENIGRLSYIQEMFDEIENNNAIINGLKGNDPEWEYLVAAVSGDLTLYGLNMSRMEIKTGGEVPGCLITGTTDDVTNLDGWMADMQELDTVGAVSLREITTQTIGDGQLVFHYEAWITIDKWNRE